jgi:peroxiredoxin
MKLLSVVVLGSVLISATVTNSASQKDVKATLTGASSRRLAPSFQLNDTTGVPVKLSAFRGRPVVLNLWATECGGCKAELPTFVDLRRRYTEKELAVIGVSMDVMYEDLKTTAEGWARVRPFVQSRGLQYTILMDDGSVEKDYRVTAMPSTFVIDKRGRVAATYVGVVDSTDLLEKVLAVVAERE